MEYEVAKKVSELMLKMAGELDESITCVEFSDEVEIKRYKRAIGQIMGTMLLDILNPIYLQYPTLKPEGLYLPEKKHTSNIEDL